VKRPTKANYKAAKKPGYLLVLIAVMILAFHHRSKFESLPAWLMAGWKFPFVAMMTLASLGIHFVLIFLSLKNSTRMSAISFVLGLVFLLSMGALASGEQTIARQWLEGWINTFAQTGFAIGTWFLFKAYSQQLAYDHSI